MALFRKSDSSAPAEQEPQRAPTPKRSERVEARRQPLVPNDRKQAKRDSAEKMRTLREQQRKGMERGDDRYLPVRDRGPVRRFVRDWVDVRLPLAELMMPVMVIVLILVFVQDREVNLIASLALWVFVAFAAGEGIIAGIFLKRRVRAKFGPDAAKGVAWYAFMRSTQLRPMRMPKPRVKRFQKLDD